MMMMIAPNYHARKEEKKRGGEEGARGRGKRLRGHMEEFPVKRRGMVHNQKEKRQIRSYPHKFQSKPEWVSLSVGEPCRL